MRLAHLRFQLGAVVLGASTGVAACETLLSEIADAETCRNQPVAVAAYAHVSDHGIWISQRPGTGGPGLVIKLPKESQDDPGIARLLAFSDSPESLKYEFRGIFLGQVECHADKPPQIVVAAITEIELIEFLDP
jgi:hypothetical protein